MTRFSRVQKLVLLLWGEVVVLWRLCMTLRFFFFIEDEICEIKPSETFWEDTSISHSSRIKNIYHFKWQYYHYLLKQKSWENIPEYHNIWTFSLTSMITESLSYLSKRIWFLTLLLLIPCLPFSSYYLGTSYTAVTVCWFLFLTKAHGWKQSI